MKKRFFTLIKFGAVGAVNTALDYGVSNILRYLLRIDGRLATALGYCAGVACSYVLNGRFTFKTKGKIISFLIVNAASLMVSIILAWTWEKLGMQFWIGKGITIFATMAINFIGYRLFVFNEPT